MSRRQFLFLSIITASMFISCGPVKNERELDSVRREDGKMVYKTITIDH